MTSVTGLIPGPSQGKGGRQPVDVSLTSVFLSVCPSLSFFHSQEATWADSWSGCCSVCSVGPPAQQHLRRGWWLVAPGSGVTRASCAATGGVPWCPEHELGRSSQGGLREAKALGGTAALRVLHSKQFWKDCPGLDE